MSSKSPFIGIKNPEWLRWKEYNLLPDIHLYKKEEIENWFECCKKENIKCNNSISMDLVSRYLTLCDWPCNKERIIVFSKTLGQYKDILTIDLYNDWVSILLENYKISEPRDFECLLIIIKVINELCPEKIVVLSFLLKSIHELSINPFKKIFEDYLQKKITFENLEIYLKKIHSILEERYKIIIKYNLEEIIKTIKPSYIEKKNDIWFIKGKGLKGKGIIYEMVELGGLFFRLSANLDIDEGKGPSYNDPETPIKLFQSESIELKLEHFYIMSIYHYNEFWKWMEYYIKNDKINEKYFIEEFNKITNYV